MLADKVAVKRFGAFDDGAHRLIEQGDQVREGVAEEAADAHGHIHAGASQFFQRNDLNAHHAAAGAMPDGAHAQQRQRLRDVVAVGAHGAGAPHAQSHFFGVVACFAAVAFQHFVRQVLPNVPGSGRRQGARVYRIEVAPRGEHVGVAPRGGAAGSGGDVTPVKRGEQVGDFVFGLAQARHQARADEGEHAAHVFMRCGKRFRQHRFDAGGVEVVQGERGDQMMREFVERLHDVARGDEGAVGKIGERRGHVLYASPKGVEHFIKRQPERGGKGGAQAGRVQVGQAGERQHQIHQVVAFGDAPQNVQAAANVRPGEFAEIAVQVFNEVGHVAPLHFGERDGRAVLGFGGVPFMHVVAVVLPHDERQILVEVGALDEVPNLALDDGQFGGVEHFNLVVFIHQLHEFSEFTVAVGGSDGRGEVVNDDGVGAAFRLCAFAGVVQDEGIDERHISEERIRVAGGGKPHAFAGQPFERAMFAHVDDGVGAPLIAQPAVERVVVVGRRQVGAVVDGVGVHAVAARRLQNHQRVAQIEGGQADVPLVDVGVAGRFAPLAHHLLALRGGQVVEPAAVLLSGNANDGVRELRFGEEGFVVRAAFQQGVDERIAVGGQVVQGVAGVAHGGEQAHERGGRIQPDGVPHFGGFARRVGQHEGDAFVGVRGAAQFRQAQRQPHHTRDAVGFGGVHCDVDRGGVGATAAFTRGGGGAFFFERDGHADDTPVKFGQGDVHGGIERVQAAWRNFPLPFAHAGGDGLHHGHVQQGKRFRRPIEVVGGGCGAAHGERQRAQQHVHTGASPFIAQECERGGKALVILLAERGGEDGQGVRAVRFDGVHQGVHKVEVAAEPVGAVEEHAHGGAGGVEPGGGGGAFGRVGGMVAPMGGQVARRFVVVGGQQKVVGEEAEQVQHVLASSGVEIGGGAFQQGGVNG